MNLTSLKNFSKVLLLKKTWKIYSNKWLMQFVKFLTCHNHPHNFKTINIFMKTQQIFMFKVSISITFCEKYDKTNAFLITC